MNFYGVKERRNNRFRKFVASVSMVYFCVRTDRGIGNMRKNWWDNCVRRRKQDEVQSLEESIRARSEKHKKAGVELDATCHLCLKTKFADGVGHICNYCNIRCCARCGGKVTLRSNKVREIIKRVQRGWIKNVGNKKAGFILVNL